MWFEVYSIEAFKEPLKLEIGFSGFAYTRRRRSFVSGFLVLFL